MASSLPSGNHCLLVSGVPASGSNGEVRCRPMLRSKVCFALLSHHPICFNIGQLVLMQRTGITGIKTRASRDMLVLWVLSVLL